MPEQPDRRPVDELVRDVLFAEPPPLLYHYTSQAGLLGIATTRMLWATNMAYLNDLSEYEYGSNVIRAAIEKYATDASAESADFINETGTSLKARARDFCLTSFTEASDLLSQWRGYADDGNGYCLGFDGESIRSRAQPEGDWYLSKCIYDPRQQEALARKLVQSWFGEWQRDRTDPKQRGFWRDLFGSSFEYVVAAVIFAFSFKHPSFAEESEWRLVMEKSETQRFRFRTGKSMITPYREFDLRAASPEQRDIALKRVIVGPSPQPELAVDSVRMLLESEELGDVEVVPSVIPYRVW